MLGGPFLDYPANRVDDIKRLLERTLDAQGPLIDFAKSVRDFHQILKRDATGYSLDSLYEKVPAPLKGYVELLYDVQNQPSLRFYEALLYKSPYYDRSAQSFAVHRIEDDHRSFLLSTPRLSSPNVLDLEMPFDDAAVDYLFGLRHKGEVFDAMCDKLNIQNDDKQVFRTFFTDTEPEAAESFADPGVRIRYFGHACLLIQTREVSLLSDPVVSYQYAGGIPRYTYDDLPEEIDYVVITHNHQDHVLLETLLRIRHKIKTLIVPRNGTGQLHDPSLKLMFRALGFSQVIEIDELETLELPGGQITALPFSGEHADLGVRSKLCHLVRLGDTSILLAADSSPVEPMLYEHVHKLVGDVDVLFLGMECDGAPLTWLYGPLLPDGISRDKDQSRRLAGCNCEQAMRLVSRFNPKAVYVYAMGQEPWLGYVMALRYSEESNPIVESNKLISECRRKGIVAERLFGMKELRFA